MQFWEAHENGSTAAMLNCAISAAAADGFEVTVVHLYQKRLELCSGCRICCGTAMEETAAFPSMVIQKAVQDALEGKETG